MRGAGKHWNADDSTSSLDHHEPYFEAKRKIERERKKENEKGEFCSTFRKDTWDSSLLKSTSVRNFKSSFANSQEDISQFLSQIAKPTSQRA